MDSCVGVLNSRIWTHPLEAPPTSAILHLKQKKNWQHPHFLLQSVENVLSSISVFHFINIQQNQLTMFIRETSFLTSNLLNDESGEFSDTDEI